MSGRTGRAPFIGPALLGLLALVLYVILVVPGAGFWREILLASLGLVVLLVPAIALGWGLRARGEERRIDRAVVAAAFGLGSLALGGLVLNVLPSGLNRWSWLGLAGVFLLAAFPLARLAPRLPPVRLPARPGGRQALMLAAAAGVTGLALVVARVGVHQPTEAFTALWLDRGTGGGFTLGVQNEEADQVAYRIDVTLDGQLVATFPSIVLSTGGDWTRQLAGPVAPGSRLEALLYREAQPAVVYRRAVVWGAAATGDASSTSSP